MSLKEEFMKITTYEEWDRRRDEFKGLDAGDMEVRKHLNELYPTADISGYEKGIVKDYFYKIDEITGKRVKIF